MKVESATGQGKGGSVAGLGSEGEKRRGRGRSTFNGFMGSAAPMECYCSSK